MKEFIEKLIGRLEEHKYSHLIEHDSEECLHCQENDDDGCGFRNCFVCVWDKAKEIINQLAEEYNNGWIPCSELPEENGMYLCTVFHADDYVVWIMRFNDGEFLKPDDVEDWNYELLAWMPIAPYQPKGE